MIIEAPIHIQILYPVLAGCVIWVYWKSTTLAEALEQATTEEIFSHDPDNRLSQIEKTMLFKMMP
jgi:hypothetical protein